MNKRNMLYVGYDYEFVADATTNYVVLENNFIRPSNALYHKSSRSGLTKYLKHLEIGHFPIIRYNYMLFNKLDKLGNFDYPHLALTDKNFHLVKEINYIINDKHYELLNKEELYTIYKAVSNNYKDYIKVKHCYIEKGYKYIPKFMTSLFFNYFRTLIEKIDEIYSNYLVYEDQVERNLEELNYKIPFSVSYSTVCDLLNYFKETNVNNLIRLFNLIDRKVLVDDNGTIYLNVKNPTKLVDIKDKYFVFMLDDNITDVYVTLSDGVGPTKRHLCFYKDGTYGYQEEIIYYHTPSVIDANNNDVFVEVEEE